MARPPSVLFPGVLPGLYLSIVSRVSRSHRQVDYRESPAELLSWFSASRALGPSVVEVMKPGARGCGPPDCGEGAGAPFRGICLQHPSLSRFQSGEAGSPGSAPVLLISPCPGWDARSCWPCRRRAGATPPCLDVRSLWWLLPLSFWGASLVPAYLRSAVFFALHNGALYFD